MKRSRCNKGVLDIEISSHCSCGGQCYKVVKMMGFDTESRKGLCLYITNEKKYGRWDLIDFILY